MIRKMFLWTLVMMVGVAGVAMAAPDRTGKVDLGVNVSAAIPTDSETDTAAYVGGTLSYGVTEWFAVGVESGWAQFDESDSGIELEDNAVPILGDLIVRYPNESQVQPYGIIGLGAIVWNIDSNLSNIESDVDTAFAAKFGGGLDWFVNGNWIVNFEFAYITSDADVTFRNATTGATASGAVDTDYWTVGGGIKYLFS